MKTKILVFAILFVSSFSFAQKAKPWEALENMKTVMKQTFPPMMKSNDLSPARSNADELYTLAQKLETEAKPKAFRGKEMAAKFSAITNIAQTMMEQVSKNASDEDVKDTLVSFHAAFAEIAHHKKAGHKEGMKGERH